MMLLYNVGSKYRKHRGEKYTYPVSSGQYNQETHINYFHNHFSVPFCVPSKEEKNNIVTVIPQSHPTAIFKVCVNNASMSLTLALPEHDRIFVKQVVVNYR